MKKVNERLVKISRALIPSAFELELGQDYQVIIEGTVVKEETVDNHDGTVNVIYVLRGINAKTKKSDRTTNEVQSGDTEEDTRIP